MWSVKLPVDLGPGWCAMLSPQITGYFGTGFVDDRAWFFNDDRANHQLTVHPSLKIAAGFSPPNDQRIYRAGGSSVATDFSQNRWSDPN